MRPTHIAARSSARASSRTVLSLLLLLLSVFWSSAAAQGQQPQQPHQPKRDYQNPVIAGDYPDPSVIRAGDDYWATTTTGNWEPEFPLLHSLDLVHWETAGAVFQQRPAWAERDFWAPEISSDGGRFFIYYTARKKNGPLCVAVATAEKPAGPYTDRGPLVCQEDGSIDASAATDEKGERYLIWKEDGNSRNQPTPIWAQKLSADGTKLTGPKKELIRNDAKWEGGVVEGPFILRREGWFYLFYSGNSCCGRRCNYALGVARSRKLLGPWEKNPRNPILAENEAWQCPGHGSIVTDKEGQSFLLYHAYRHGETAFYIGREALLDEVKWGADGWPSINGGHGPSQRAPLPEGGDSREDGNGFFDDFDAGALHPAWRWAQDGKPLMRLETERDGRLILAPQESLAREMLGAAITRPTTGSSYVATALLDASMLTRGTLAGLCAYAWRGSALGIVAGEGKISVFVREENKQRMLASEALSFPGPIRGGSTGAGPTRPLYLRLTARDGAQFRFAYSYDGRDWKALGEEVNGSYLEPVNIALTAGGAAGASASFEWVRLAPSSR